MKKKKIKLRYVDDWDGFKDCCSKAKGKRDFTEIYDIIYYGPDTKKISKEVDNELP